MQNGVEKAHEGLRNTASFPLALAGEGEKVRIVHVKNSRMLQERLLSMGLHLEDEIQVVQRQFGGAVLIEKTGSRYAMGGGMAHKISVVRC
ncbi:MAG TPA: ferrous iron transport protein A [Desulfobulbaceae bacterium]|nr:ferrous iron transport protein A [Desulfobulbaceae bacterium]